MGKYKFIAGCSVGVISCQIPLKNRKKKKEERRETKKKVKSRKCFSVVN